MTSQSNHNVENSTQHVRGMDVYAARDVEEVVEKSGQENDPVINGDAPTVKKLH